VFLCYPEPPSGCGREHGKPMKSTQNSLLKQLNKQQQRATLHTEGPLLVLAGAGSGKTRTITQKIGYLIAENFCAPDQILAVTFTNKAAGEMKERVLELVSELPRPPLVSTFHSFAVRTLRRYATRLGYQNDFSICDAEDQRAIYRQLLNELDLQENDQLPPRRVQAIVSHAKNRGWSADEYMQKSTDILAPLIYRCFQRYQEYLLGSNSMDFDDLILNLVKLLKQEEDIRERYGNGYRYFLVDEYQDTNRPQYDLLRLLTSYHQNLTAVGDEDQSIYGFRGADIENILRFEKDFPGAEVVKLEQNYRSTQMILDAATAVVSNNQDRKGKVLWTEGNKGDLVDLFAADDARHEAFFICQRIYQLRQMGDESIAILYRTNFQSRQFEERLNSMGIGYRLVGGTSFYNRKEIKDALAYLRVSRNPDDDVALTRIINQPPRGIGKKTLERLRELGASQRKTLWSSLTEALQEKRLPGRTLKALRRFQELVQACGKALELNLPLALDRILEDSGYFESLRSENSEEANNRLLNLQELQTAARESAESGLTLQDFLDSAALYSDTDEIDSNVAVTLMTLHNAKGLEFNTVFLVGCEEGLFPHSRSLVESGLEEERRLCYVGMTRARERLSLSYSKTRRFFGRSSEGHNEPSRFLNEIPPHLVRTLPEFQIRPSAYRSGFRQSSDRPAYGGKTYNSPREVRQFLQDLPPKKSTSSGSHSRLAKGDLVEHGKFGAGRILALEGKGDDLRVTVHFFDAGIRKLVQKYAQLKRR